MGNKLILDVDDDIWRQFSATCKARNIRPGAAITNILKKELGNNNFFDKIKRIRG